MQMRGSLVDELAECKESNGHEIRLLKAQVESLEEELRVEKEELKKTANVSAESASGCGQDQVCVCVY